MKRFVLLLTFTSIFLISLHSWEPKGPLRGKNYYVPFAPFYSFPETGASIGERNTLNINLSTYYVQDIVTEFHVYGESLIQERFIDYEGFVIEPSLSYNVLDTLEVGVTSRFHGYYGGVFDPLFELFHGLFDFPNGGREFYSQNDIYVNIITTSGLNLQIDENTFAFGDTDLSLKWNFLSLSFLDLSFFSALKLPTGAMENLTGSGYADLAIALQSDFYVGNRWAFYLENGLIIPGQLFYRSENPLPPIYHLLAGTEFLLTPRFSLLLQFKLNTSPIGEEVTEPIYITHTVKLVKPMTNLIFGAIWELGKLDFQFSVEEDAFTNNGADLILNFNIGTNFSLFR